MAGIRRNDQSVRSRGKGNIGGQGDDVVSTVVIHVLPPDKPEPEI